VKCHNIQGFGGLLVVTPAGRAATPVRPVSGLSALVFAHVIHDERGNVVGVGAV
jgi:hypothetical protein